MTVIEKTWPFDYQQITIARRIELAQRLWDSVPDDKALFPVTLELITHLSHRLGEAEAGDVFLERWPLPDEVRPVYLHPGVTFAVGSAVRSYDQLHSELGQQFQTCCRDAIGSIARGSARCDAVAGPFRRIKLAAFPHHLFFAIDFERRLILLAIVEAFDGDCRPRLTATVASVPAA